MGTIAKPNTFATNTTISSSDVNDNFDTIYNEFNGNISAANLASNAVTTAKIADSNVTTAKIADSNVTTAKIADSNVTTAKIADKATTSEKLTPTVGFYATTTQSVGSGAVSDITTYSEVIDYGSDFNPTTGVFTAPYTGFYHFDIVMTFTDASDRINTTFKKNGTGIAFAMGYGAAANNDPSANLSISVNATAGDTFLVTITNNTAGSEALVLSSFSGFMVGQV